MTGRLSWNFLGGVLLALLVTTTAEAQPSAVDVPATLEPWVPWVLHGEQDALCPQVAGKAVCGWPTTLSLSLSGSGGRFAMTVHREHEGAVRLPGDARRFPQGVTLDGRAAVVLDGPEVTVPAGTHRIEGAFVWPRLPESLATPKDVGLLDLSVDGQPVAYPRRETTGMLWLQATAAEGGESERLALLVSRRIEDGVPLRIVTRVDITVGGKARELVLSGAVLKDTRPVQLESKLPARLEPDGKLRLQVAAGQHRVEVIAVAPTPPSALTMPALPEPWPSQEIWVFAPAPELRQVELSGAPQIDPDRTNLDEDFRGLATYVMSKGKSLKFDTRRRGDAAPAPNTLRVSREMWLDLDGQAFTVRDYLTGAFNQGFRLNLVQGDLGRMQMDGTDQLVTVLGDQAGIEVRNNHLRLNAEWRLPNAGGTIPAVGWSEDASSLSTELHLPPGVSLLHAGGADDVSGTLLSRWDLWDFFFVLLVALGVAKLAGKLYFPVALVALALSHHVADAPGLMVLWLLLALALTRVARTGLPALLSRLMLWASLAGVLIALVPFAVTQVRSALYPQLSSMEQPSYEMVEEEAAPVWLEEEAIHADEEGGIGRGAAASMPLSDSANKFGIEGPARLSPAQGSPEQAKPGSGSLWGGDRYGAANAAAVQTGPGIPTWSHDTYRIEFSGPVQQGAQLQLYILSRTTGRILAIVRVLFYALLLFGLLRGQRLGLPKAPVSGVQAATVALLLLSGLGITSVAVPAHAQPASLADVLAPITNEDPLDDTILSELRRRLLSPPACAPKCVNVPELALAVDGDVISIQAEVHAAALSAYRVPGPLSVWAPSLIQVDGRPASGAMRADAGSLFLRMEPGVHRVTFKGRMQDASGALLHLGTLPHHVTLVAPDFEVDGLREDGTTADTLQLRRRVETNADAEAVAPALPPFVEVKRRFELGVDFRLHTQLHRLGSLGAPLVVRYPLLEGESVNSANVEVEKGQAVIHFSADQAEVTFESSLSPRERLSLAAPEVTTAQPTTVTWEVLCSPLYHCEFEGLSPVQRHLPDGVGYRFKPYPSEQLAFSLARLPAAKGAATTVDHASLSYQPGERMTLGELHLSVRSSAGTVMRVDLPAGAKVSEAQLDGKAMPTRSTEGALEIAVAPGSHEAHVNFQLDDGGMGAVLTTQAVRVDGELVNVELNVQVPSSRWLLWASGPQWGPAVLFWGHLFVILLAAFALGRVPQSPLRTHQWMLLALGLSQVSTAAALVVVAWFFLMQLRARWTPPGHFRFNAIQVLLIWLTVGAAGVLADAVHRGLVVQPDMQVAGYNSHRSSLSWYVDRVQDAFPQATVISVPLWVYKGLMLAWALWLAASALSFLRFGWEAFSTGDRFRSLRGSRLFRSRDKTPVTEPDPAAGD